MDRVAIVNYASREGDPSDPERRFTLIDFNIEHIEAAYAKARSNGTEEPCVIVADLTDADARSMVEVLNGDNAEYRAYLDRVIAECKSEGSIPTGYAIMRRWDLLKAMRMFQRELHRRNSENPRVSSVVEQLNAPAPNGSFYCLAVSFGKQLGPLPIPQNGSEVS